MDPTANGLALPKRLADNSLLREIVTTPDERLRKVCLDVPISRFNTEELYSQAGQMILALWKHDGIGLAANQLGYDNRVIAVVPDPARNRHKRGYPIVMCNPWFAASPLNQVMPEGCLSFPGQKAIVKRSARISLAYTTIDGAQVTMKCEGLLAQCVQHEIDHLNGITFLDAR